MATAKLIKDLGFNGNAAQKVYKVSPALEAYNWCDEDEEAESYEYIVVSVANVPSSGPETYIFGSDENGKILDWGELPGSFRGSLDYERALRNAGYTDIS